MTITEFLANEDPHDYDVTELLTNEEPLFSHMTRNHVLFQK